MQIRKGVYIYTDSDLYDDCYYNTMNQVKYLIGKVVKCHTKDGIKMCEVDWQNDNNGINTTDEEISHVKRHFKTVTKIKVLTMIL